MDRRYHFGYFSGFHALSWQRSDGRWDVHLWTAGHSRVRLARRFGATHFDLPFSGNSLGGPSFPDVPIDAELMYALTALEHDPRSPVPVTASGAPHLRLVTTGSMIFAQSSALAHTLSAIGLFRMGNARWNSVKLSEREAAEKFGMTSISRKGERYDRADRSLEVAERCWESRNPASNIAGAEVGIGTDCFEVRAIDGVGEYSAVRGDGTRRRPANGLGRSRKRASRRRRVRFGGWRIGDISADQRPTAMRQKCDSAQDASRKVVAASAQSGGDRVSVLASVIANALVDGTAAGRAPSCKVSV